MQLLVVNLFLFFIFLVLNVYVFDVSVNVSPASSSISLSALAKVHQRPEFHTQVSYSIYVTFDLIRIISILFLWAIHLLSGIICIKVRFINFKSNISVLPKPHATQFLSSQNFQSWLYLSVHVFVTFRTHFIASCAGQKYYIIFSTPNLR